MRGGAIGRGCRPQGRQHGRARCRGRGPHAPGGSAKTGRDGDERGQRVLLQAEQEGEQADEDEELRARRQMLGLGLGVGWALARRGLCSRRRVRGLALGSRPGQASARPPPALPAHSAVVRRAESSVAWCPLAHAAGAAPSRPHASCSGAHVPSFWQGIISLLGSDSQPRLQAKRHCARARAEGRRAARQRQRARAPQAAYGRGARRAPWARQALPFTTRSSLQVLSRREAACKCHQCRLAVMCFPHWTYRAPPGFKSAALPGLLRRRRAAATRPS